MRDGRPDIHIKCGGQIFRAHKAFLIARCGEFAKPLEKIDDTSTDMQASGKRLDKPIIPAFSISGDMNPRIFEIILEYVYTGKLPNNLPLNYRNEMYKFALKNNMKSLMYTFLLNKIKIYDD